MTIPNATALNFDAIPLKPLAANEVRYDEAIDPFTVVGSANSKLPASSSPERGKTEDSLLVEQSSLLRVQDRGLNHLFTVLLR
ncbi:hypothetical protein [Egbenema bharatensis]|uniref:hypothetical protein n=1 Tax=Egbenema bharatensis TaxID=3463334 RepID=UPI003A89D79F